MHFRSNFYSFNEIEQAADRLGPGIQARDHLDNPWSCWGLWNPSDSAVQVWHQRLKEKWTKTDLLEMTQRKKEREKYECPDNSFRKVAKCCIYF